MSKGNMRLPYQKVGANIGIYMIGDFVSSNTNFISYLKIQTLTNYMKFMLYCSVLFKNGCVQFYY
jgi:hypothetical protein